MMVQWLRVLLMTLLHLVVSMMMGVMRLLQMRRHLLLMMLLLDVLHLLYLEILLCLVADGSKS